MSNGSFENLIRRAANRLGIDIHRLHPETSDMARLSLMLANQKINLVFDVGANTGQFGESLRNTGYLERIVSFEPLSIAHACLLQVSRNDPKWNIAARSAVGGHDGEIEMHVAENSVSSSALDMLDSHVAAAPNSTYVGAERVPLLRLDTISRDYMTPGSIPLLKIDTQGYEDRVLDGATELLLKTKGIHLELSLVPLYEGQKLFDDLIQRIQDLGFSIWAIWPGFCDPQSGRMLQVDATFFRDQSAPSVTDLTSVNAKF